jgi:hypothetical protein
MSNRKIVIVLVLIAIFILVPARLLAGGCQCGGATIPATERGRAATWNQGRGVIDDNFGSDNFVNTIPWGFDSVTPGSRVEFKNIHPCRPS